MIQSIKSFLLYIISLVLTLSICGFSAQNTAEASISIVILLWIQVLKNIKATTSFAVNNPQQHNPELIVHALDNCLEEVKSSGKTRKMIISNPGLNTLTIQSSVDKRLNLKDFHRTLPIENGDLWIAEHPIPLQFEAGKHRQLNFTPAGDGRIHVSTGRRTIYYKLPLMLMPAAVILFFMNSDCFTAALTAPVIYTLISRRFE